MPNQLKYEKRVTVVLRGDLAELIERMAEGTGHHPVSNFRAWMRRHFADELKPLPPPVPLDALPERPPFVDLSTADADDQDPRF